MSRSKISSQDLSSTDSEDDFQTKKNSTLERPLSALSGNLKRVDTILNETSDEDEKSTPVKSQTLKSGSTTSIASRIKNIFRPSSSKKKGDKKSLENKIKSATKSDTETEESRSIERSIKNVLKSQKSLEKTNEFERPSTRLDINNSSSTTTSATDRSLDSDRTEKDGVSDNDSSGKLKKAINSSLSSDSPGSSRSSIKHKDSIKKHSDSNTSSESDSDTELEQQALPIRVKIEKKPPIDKSKWKLEKPNSDSDISDKDSTQRDGDVKKSATISSKKERSRFLSKTFDLNSDNSGSSGNEMTDVSPLPTPKNSEPNKFSMNVFYKALESDNIRVDSYGNKMAKRINTVKKVTGPGPIQKSRSCDNDYEYKSNCHNSIDYESFGFKMSPLRGTRPTDISKTSFSKLLDQSLVNSPYTKAQRPFRVTSSALNRQREQQRIEKENQAILKRLLQVKASKHVVKEEQIKDYEKNFGLSTMNFSKMTPLVMMESRVCTSSYSRMSSKQPSYKSTANNSRCSSAKSTYHHDNHFSSVSQTSIDPNEMLRRATSASRRRPQWNDKW